MKVIAALLNLPLTLIGLFLALISVPSQAWWQNGAFIFRIRSWWWTKPLWWLKGIRGFASGNVVVLGPNEEPRDLEHELVHVEQYNRYPLFFPLLYALESGRGPQGNRFEREAYGRAGNIYHGK